MTDLSYKDVDLTDINALASHTDVSSLNEQDIAKLKNLVHLQQEMSDHLIAQFENNIKAFEKYYPEIAEAFKNYRPTKDLEFFCTENKIPNLYIPKIKEVFYKTADPFKLCELQVKALIKSQTFSQTQYSPEWDPWGQIHHRYMNEAIKVEKSYNLDEATPRLANAVPACLMLGVGLGYSLGYLYENIEIANLILVEPDPDIFFASLHSFDWAPLLEHISNNKWGLYIIVGTDKDNLFVDLLKYYKKHGRFLSGFLWTFIHYRNKQINELADVITKDFYRTHAAMGFFDDHLFAISHGMDYFKKHYPLIRSKKELPKEDRELPLFIVGNGPSLDNDIDFLRKNQDKAIILACGTALDSLYNAGIQADFYGVTERIIAVAESIEVIPDKSYLDNVMLLASDVVHPRTTALFKKKAIFGKIDEPFMWGLCQNYNEYMDWRVANLMNPLVSNFGLSAAISLHFKNIYLFGCDCGRKANNFFHSKKSSVYFQNVESLKDLSKVNLEKRPNETEVPANFGGVAYISSFYGLCKRNLEFLMEIFRRSDDEIDRNFTVYNCSDGAKIEHTIPLKSSDFDMSKYKDIDKKDFIDRFIKDMTYCPTLSEQDLEKILYKEEFNKIIDCLIKIWDERPKTRLDFTLKMESCSEFVSHLSDKQFGHYFTDLLDGSLDGMFITTQRCLYKQADEKQAMEHANKIIDILIYYLEDMKYLYSFMPNYALGDHHELLKGKLGQDHGDFKATELKPIPPLFKNGYNPLFGVTHKFVKRYS